MTGPDSQNDRVTPAFLDGGATMGALVRGFDWIASPLGAPATWPAALRTLVELLLASKQPMFLAWGPEQTWLYNDAFIPIAGRKHPGSLGRAACEVWPEAWTELQPLFDRVLSGEPVHMTDFVVGLDRKGVVEEAHFDFSYTPVRCEAEQVRGLFGVCVETTERVTSDRAKLATANRERERLFEVSRDLFAVATFDGHLKSINPAWSRRLGRTDEELLANPFSEFIHPGDLALTAGVVAALQSGQPVHQFHIRLLRADGEAIPFAWSAVPDAEPGTGIFYTVGRDITEETMAAAELQAAQEALRQSQKMEAVGQLTGGIAHDFNNMLQAIGGSLEMVQRRVEQGRAEDVPRHVDSARATVARAAALTHRLLAFARRQSLQPKRVEVDRLILGMMELVRQTVGPAITVELHVGDGTWPVLCDPNQLENVLLNLAVNARDAMADGGHLILATRHVALSPADFAGQDGGKPGAFVEIAVADTGTGMDNATRARAFEPFFTTKPIGQGTGLGLSQIYGFAQQSGGLVRLDSAPGQGTTVRLLLPRQDDTWEPDCSSHPGVAPGQPGAGGTVLLVEDKADVRATAAEHLRELGYSVMEAEDGSAALRVLRSGRRVDLLVTDVGLPGGMNGRQVADAACERQPGLPTLFITGFAGSVLDGQLAPGMEVIGKPFALDALAAKVRAMLALAPAA